MLSRSASTVEDVETVFVTFCVEPSALKVHLSAALLAGAVSSTVYS